MPFASLILTADDPRQIPMESSTGFASGAEGASAAADVMLYPAIAAVVTFLVVFVILAKLVWPKILGGLDDRQKKIQGDIAQAEQSRAEAEKAKVDFEAQLAEARKQAAETVAQAKADAQRVADELRAANDAELTQLRTKAMADIESAKSAAVAEIHAEAGALATAVASKILGREITVADQQQLVQESLAEMKG